MILDQYVVVAIVIIIITSLTLLISQNWRRFILVFSLQYLAIFWLVALIWPVGLAVVKLVVGWMAGAMLGASQTPSDLKYEDTGGISGRLFRLLSASMVWILSISIAPILANWLPANNMILLGGLILIGMGLLQLGMTTLPLRVIVGLLTLLSGFEIIYAVVETSVLVAGLLAVVNLVLALTGAYMLAVTESEEVV